MRAQRIMMTVWALAMTIVVISAAVWGIRQLSSLDWVAAMGTVAADPHAKEAPPRTDAEVMRVTEATAATRVRRNTRITHLKTFCPSTFQSRTTHRETTRSHGLTTTKPPW
jgi:hypothetical protein